MKFVKINPSRGHGSDVWEVISQEGSPNDPTYNLKNTKTGERLKIYKAHTYFDRDCLLSNREHVKAKAEAAKSIGKSKKKPGKK